MTTQHLSVKTRELLPPILPLFTVVLVSGHYDNDDSAKKVMLTLAYEPLLYNKELLCNDMKMLALSYITLTEAVTPWGH